MPQPDETDHASDRPLLGSMPPGEAGEVAESDFLVRFALSFVAAIYPIARVRVAYRLVQNGNGPEVEQRFASSASSSLENTSDEHQDVRPVPDAPRYERVTDIALNEKVAHLLGRQTGAEHLGQAHEHILLAIELAEAWTGRLGEAGDRDAREVLRSAFPPRLVAHLAAEHLARSQEAGGRQTRGEGSGCRSDSELHAERDPKLPATLVHTIEYMNDLARSRVEDQELSHGVVVAPRREEASQEDTGPRRGLPPGRYPRSFRALKRTPLLSDGYHAALRLAPDGRPIEVILRPELLEEGTAPHRRFGEFSFLAAASQKHDGISLMLRPGGTLVLFASGRPLFIRRAGRWRGMIWDAVRNLMAERYGAVGERVFDTALLLTTSGRGGILAIMEEVPEEGISEKDRADHAREHVFAEPGEEDPGETPSAQGETSPDVPPEWLFHTLLRRGNATEMDPSSLALLASIDGATLFGSDGTLLSYGAIVPSRQSRSEGARTAAARTLSRDGFVLKVSEDGPIDLFENGEQVLTI